MMGRHAKQNELWSEPVNLAGRIPMDHPLRKLKSVLDLEFARSVRGRAFHIDIGRFSFDPVPCRVR